MNNTTNAVCYAKAVDPNFLWGDVPPLLDPVPTLVLQLALAITVNHGLMLVLKQLHQPRIVSDIISAIVLSPSTLGQIHHRLETTVWPVKSITVLETMANLGLLYCMFIKGLHMDLTLVTRKRMKTLCISSFTVGIPFAIGCISYFVFRYSVDPEHSIHNLEVVSVYWGTITAATSFPTVAPIVANLKLLCTDIGREVLSVGMMSDVFSWLLILMTLAISSSPTNDEHHHAAIGWVFLWMVLFVLFCVLVIRPAISKLVGDSPEGENYNDFTVHLILFLVLACGVIADFIGSHFLFGAFVLGMCMPNGVLASTLIDKMEDCVLGVLMPLYFMVIGGRVNIIKLLKELQYTWVIIIAVAAKTLCTFATSLFYNIAVPDGLALGVLLSAKGLLPLVILNIGRERGHIPEDSFITLLLILLVSTMLVGPIMAMGYKRLRKTSLNYEQRTLEGANPTEELRIVTCIHSPQNVPSIINLLEISNITTESPVSVSVLHLVELIGRASAMLIEHDSSDSFLWSARTKPFFNRIETNSNQIITAFHDFEENHNVAPFIQTLTIVSPIETMHEDIYSLAEKKQANLIILPFHKQQGVDGMLEDANIEFRVVNQNIMAMAPCSVGLLVDRGLKLLSLSTLTPMSNSTKMSHEATQIAMVYLGGPDDREALTYAWRMANHPFVTLTVIRFVVGDYAMDDQSMHYPEMGNDDNEVGILTEMTRYENERKIDEKFMQAFQQTIRNDEKIHYIEKVSNNGEETISSLREIQCDYDLYIVGKGQSKLSPLTVGLADWTECPELGTMGDILVTSDFTSNASVLVIQQYGGGMKHVKEEEYDKKVSTSYV